MTHRLHALAWQSVVVWHAWRVERLSAALDRHMGFADHAQDRVHELIPEGWLY
jgi:hypothetical protein